MQLCDIAYRKKGRASSSSVVITGMHPAATASNILRLEIVSPLGQKQNLFGKKRTKGNGKRQLEIEYAALSMHVWNLVSDQKLGQTWFLFDART